MKTSSRDYARVHKVASGMQKRMDRELLAAVRRIQTNVSLMNPLISPLVFGRGRGQKQLAQSLKLVVDKLVAQELKRVGIAIKEAVLHGGKLGEQKLRGVTRGR